MLPDMKWGPTLPSLSKGFTLIELIVVITILAVSLGVVVPTYIGFQKTRDVTEAREVLKSFLRRAQNNAQSGKVPRCPSERPSLLGWYVTLSANQSQAYIRARCYLVSDTAYADSAIFAENNYSDSEVIQLPGNVGVSNIIEAGTPVSQVEIYYLSAGKGLLFRKQQAAGGWVRCCAGGVTIAVASGSDIAQFAITGAGEIADAP